MEIYKTLIKNIIILLLFKSLLKILEYINIKIFVKDIGKFWNIYNYFY
jgi:hypothetical protein